jgi:hypothetical protein
VSWPATGTTTRSGPSPSGSRRERLATVQADRGDHQGGVRVVLEQTLLPVLRQEAAEPFHAVAGQNWMTKAAADGLSPRSIQKYHTMLHSIFKRAVRDQLIVANPCEHTELPKVITRKSTTITADEFDRLLAAIPERHRVWSRPPSKPACAGENFIALRPRHIDFLRKWS